MSESRIIQAALQKAGLNTEVVGTRNLSGGCIHQVIEIELADRSRVVAKINRADQLQVFEEEAHGLRALAETRTVVVPKPLLVAAHFGRAVLLMTHIAPGSATVEASRQFGIDLARLHAADAGTRYGFERDNHIGSTPQPNAWRDDWVEFNRVNRLGFQLETARRNGLLEAREAKEIERVIDRLEQFIPRRPKPSLLHGDLWSGNALPTKARHATFAVIDPACSIGDAWADIAMMKLFGGFSNACCEAYEHELGSRQRTAGEGDFGREKRLAVYQVYHLLNHVNIFGRGYVGQVLAMADRLR